MKYLYNCVHTVRPLVPRIGIQFISDSPRVENNTVEVDFILTRPTTKVTCQLNKEEQTDCKQSYSIIIMQMETFYLIRLLCFHWSTTQWTASLILNLHPSMCTRLLLCGISRDAVQGQCPFSIKLWVCGTVWTNHSKKENFLRRNCGIVQSRKSEAIFNPVVGFVAYLNIRTL